MTDADRPIRSPHSFRHRAGRALWGLVQGTLFRWSPRPLFAWRRFLLSLFGARLHRHARIYPRARIWAPWNLEMDAWATLADDVDCYSVERTIIGRRATVSQYAYLCGATHDFEQAHRPLVPMPITIGPRAWIAADVFVGPGVTIGEGTVVGARSSVFKDLPPWTVCVGSPAKPIRDLERPPEPGEPNATTVD
jgi:putative colanic acid biosynthesis acetyltransferase WcaF